VIICSIRMSTLIGVSLKWLYMNTLAMQPMINDNMTKIQIIIFQKVDNFNRKLLSSEVSVQVYVNSLLSHSQIFETFT
jgi:hypothetical protein